MFAVIGRWSLDAEQANQQRQVLVERIVPGVKQADGFISGYWSEPSELGEAHTFIVFQRREQAESFAERVRQNAPNRESRGVRDDELIVAELMAHA